MSYLTIIEDHNGEKETLIVKERSFDAQRPCSAACKAFSLLSAKTNCSIATIKVFFKGSINPKTYSVTYSSVNNAFYKKKPIATKINISTETKG